MVYACVMVCVCDGVWTYSIPPLQVQLQQAKERADEFDQSHRSLHAGLSGVEEAQEKEEPIHSEVEVVKQQLEAHKVRVTPSPPNCFCPTSIQLSAPLPYHHNISSVLCFWYLL